MTSDADATAEKLASIPNVEIIVATFVDRATDGMVSVDFGQGPVVILSAGVTEPLPGDPVRVLRVNSTTIMVGPAYPLSGIGTVTATGTPKLTVTTSAGSRQLPFLTSYSAVNGDLVLIDWSSGGVVIGKVTAAPAGAYAPPAPVIADFEVDFRAFTSGSYQGSWNKNDVWASDSNVGAWFFGTVLYNTIPDSAVIKRVQVYLPEFYNVSPAAQASIGLHGLPGPSGAPSLSALTPIPGGSGWFDLPNSFGDELKTGTSLGVGVQQAVAFSGFHKYYGTATDPDSGMLRIAWSSA